MKFKHVVASLSLAMFTAFGVAAGLSMKKEAKVVKADADTWMINFSMDFNSAASFEGFNPDSVWVQTYTDGVGNANWYHMYPLKTGSTFYQVNATFADAYTFNRVQFKFSQGETEKWGQPYTMEISKEDYPYQLSATFENSWPEDNVFVFYLYKNPNIFAEYKDVEYYLEPDVASKSFKVSNLVCDGSDYFTFYYRQGWSYCSEVLSDTANDYMSHIDDAWASMDPGTYDIVLKNDNSFNGVVDVIKREEPTESFIYYVLENNTPTNDYIYSWGGSEQFGAWPGTKITEVEDVEELTGNGLLHFQGSETPKLIYRIPVTKGFPSGDVYFKFNNNNDWESEARVIYMEYAYWYTGAANHDAAQAIQFLELLETYRNKVDDDSVCNVTKDDATYLVNLYNAYDDETLETYVDCSSVYTWADASKTSETLISVKDIMEQLGKIAGVAPKGSSLSFNQFELANSNTAIIVIAVTATSALALTLLLVFKKRKHQ